MNDSRNANIVDLRGLDGRTDQRLAILAHYDLMGTPNEKIVQIMGLSPESLSALRREPAYDEYVKLYRAKVAARLQTLDGTAEQTLRDIVESLRLLVSRNLDEIKGGKAPLLEADEMVKISTFLGDRFVDGKYGKQKPKTAAEGMSNDAVSQLKENAARAEAADRRRELRLLPKDQVETSDAEETLDW